VTTPPEFPLTTGNSAGLVFGATVAPADTCNGQPCWRTTAHGFRYRDVTGTSGGLRRIDLRGKAGLFDLTVKARGPNVELPASLAGVGAPLVAELRSQTPSGCWQTRFGEETIRRRAATLKAEN
jgi:hypothetical protein